MTTSNAAISIGECKVVSIRDGELELGPEVFTGISDTEIAQCLTNAGLPSGPVSGSLNAYLVQTAGRNILIDTGGKSAIPTTGELMSELSMLGVKPGDIDTVLCTHLHPDHIGGLIEDGEAVFNNAELKINAAELDFWMSADNRAQAPEMFQGFFDLANAVLAVYENRTSTFQGQATVAPGIQSIPLPGHTPGHTGFQIGDDKGLLIWGDIVHVQAFQMPQPKACVAFDVDPDMAVKTRTDVLNRAVADRLRIAGMHLAHPGIGYVVQRGNGYWLESE